MSGRHSYRGPMNGRGQRTNTKLGVRPVDIKKLLRLVGDCGECDTVTSAEPVCPKRGGRCVRFQ